MAYYRLDILQAVLYQCHSNLHVHEGCKNEPDTNIYDIMFAYAYYQLMQDLQILTADSLSASCRILGGPLVGDSMSNQSDLALFRTTHLRFCSNLIC